jgi:hypothetical protein
MFRFRRWLFVATVALGSRLDATPTLSTIQDVLFSADGNRFNGLVTISWQSFEAADLSNVASETKRLQVVNGLLFVQLVPTTNASTAVMYTVQYYVNGKALYNEAWAVPPSSVPLRVRDIRLPPGAITGSTGTGSNSSPGSATIVQIADVVGLQAALNLRPTAGPGFGVSRAAVIDSTGGIAGATGNISDCIHVDGTGGPCGTGGASTGFVDGEYPAGTLDGLNATFTLTNVPNPASSVQMFRNGLFLKPGADYTVSGNSVTFLAGAVPQPGDAMLTYYRLSVNIAGVGFVDAETPAGAINGVNTSFTLGQTPSPGASLAVYRNGVRMKSGVDYSLNAATITFMAGVVPQAGDILLCSYRVAQ